MRLFYNGFRWVVLYRLDFICSCAMILGMNINYSEIVGSAMSPRERKIQSLTSTIIRSSFVGTFFLCVGIGAVIFMTQHLNQPNLELDSFIGKIFSGITILSIIVVVVSGSKVLNAWTEKNHL